ncbi:hypothetical protein NUM3379_44110 [Kineococcus sp. NUM-3379]
MTISADRHESTDHDDAEHSGSRLRRLPMPVCEPPFAGEPGAVTSTAPHVGPGQGVLALNLKNPRRTGLDESFAAPRPTTSSDLPEAQQWGRRYVQVLLEVLDGKRPTTQLLRWSSTEVYSTLQKRAALSARVRRPGGPRRLPAVLSVRTCVPRDGVVETSAVVVDSGRVRAIALRMEGWDGRWRVTALETA